MAHYFSFEYEVRAIEHPTYLPGRVGEIVRDGTAYGLIGELHSKVLDAWNLAVPVSVFEVDLAIVP